MIFLFLLSIKEILQSKFAYSVNFDDYKRCGALPVNNTSEEIKNFAEEVCNIIEGKKEEKEDIEIKDAFWRTYTSYVHKDKIGPYKVNLGANFLRKNIDLIK